MISLSIELTSYGTDEIGSVRKIQSETNVIRLIVTLPRDMDEEQANLTAALLLQQLERLPEPNIHIERVKIAGLRFTTASVVGIQSFLAAQAAATVKHVSIKDMVVTDDPDSIQAFATLATAFAVSSLETLNLSDNRIDKTLWQHWAMHRNLRQLILDYVEITNESLVELAQHFTFGDHLSELYVVLTNSITRQGQNAANEILRKCEKLVSLRWAEKDAPETALLPWNGLYDMASSNPNTCLIHLVMDGGTIQEEELGDEGLCGAVSRFHKLRTLKLRGVGLKDEGAQAIVKSIKHAKPPLETLDLGKNGIKTLGSMAVAKLSSVESISRSLVLLALDRNSIDTGGAREILECFAATTANARLEIKLDMNPFNYGKLAFNLARRKAQADRECNDMRSMSQINSTKDTKKLEEEISKLREEKASLLKVLSIVNSQNGAREMERTLDRISNLEKSVLGSTATTATNNSNWKSSTATASRVGENSLGRLLGRAKSSRDVGRFANESASTMSQGFHSPTKKSSPRIGTPSHPTPSPNRRASGTTPNSQNNQIRNSLIRGISERWSSPKHTKKKHASTIQSSPSPSPSPSASKYFYPHHIKDISYPPISKQQDLDSWNRTNHSSSSASSHNQNSWESHGHNCVADLR